ncbi:hypothetical protein CsatB_025962 [Cannabis sativa]
MVLGDRKWDEEIVRDVFNNRDAEKILSIPLFYSAGADKWHWGFDKSGEYTVSSAYKFQQDQKNESIADVDTRFWQRFWKIKVPPKALNLVWRALTNCLPTRVQLISRHVSVQRTCPRCQIAAETAFHALLSCPRAYTCWFAAGLASGVVADQTFGNWFVAAAARWNDDNLRLAVMLCWAIWQARNDQVWKGNSRTSRYILALAGGNLNQWRYAQDKTFVPSQFNLKPNEGGELWTKPVGNTIKINVDAAIFESQNRYGFGWVARNNEGRLLWAKSSSFCGSVSAEFAEALGLKKVLSWLKDNDLSNVVIESDSLVTIQAVRSSISFSSTFGFCVTECQSLLSNLCDVDLCFIKRYANRVAHHLARASVSYADCMYRESNVPATLMDVIRLDI